MKGLSEGNIGVGWLLGVALVFEPFTEVCPLFSLFFAPDMLSVVGRVTAFLELRRLRFAFGFFSDSSVSDIYMSKLSTVSLNGIFKQCFHVRM